MQQSLWPPDPVSFAHTSDGADLGRTQWVLGTLTGSFGLG